MYEFTGLVDELRPYAEGLLSILNGVGLNPQVTSTVRSTALQRRLYQTYLNGQSKYPAAPPGYSAHEYGWAFDIQINDSSYYQDAGELWESWGGTWGGRFHDQIHFELGGATQYLHSLRGGGQVPAPPPIASPEPSQTSVWDSPLGDVALAAASAGDWVLDRISGIWHRS